MSLVCLCYLTTELYPPSNIDALELGYIGFGWTMNATCLASCWITVVETIKLKFCVVLPFFIQSYLYKIS